MGKNSKPLSHAEIWDDSALVQSWDDAVEEYKLYHSIHAKGQNVEDVLREAQEAENTEGTDGDVFMEAEGKHTSVDSAVDVNKQAEAETKQDGQAPQVSRGSASIPGITPAGAGPAPQAVLAQVQDEGLKNLMMSWYFAGYYTGLYEGQQQGSQNRSS